MSLFKTAEEQLKEKRAYIIDSMIKEALITGTSPSRHMSYSTRWDPNEHMPAYTTYLKRKSTEPKSNASTAAAIGGGIGAIVGALAGLSGKGKSPIIAGGLVGGGLGALLGLMSKAMDDGNIDQAKRILTSADVESSTKAALMRELDLYDAHQEANREWRAERRHRETLMATSGPRYNRRDGW